MVLPWRGDGRARHQRWLTRCRGKGIHFLALLLCGVCATANPFFESNTNKGRHLRDILSGHQVIQSKTLLVEQALGREP